MSIQQDGIELILNTDFVVVPFAGVDLLRFLTSEDGVAARFVVELAPPTSADIGLIAADLVMIRDALGAELDARIARGGNELDL